MAKQNFRQIYADASDELHNSTSGAVVTISQSTTLERGSGVETFIYRIAGTEAVLMGYHIDSNDMLIN
jgi:hypothetical protein